MTFTNILLQLYFPLLFSYVYVNLNVFLFLLTQPLIVLFFSSAVIYLLSRLLPIAISLLLSVSSSFFGIIVTFHSFLGHTRQFYQETARAPGFKELRIRERGVYMRERVDRGLSDFLK